MSNREENAVYSSGEGKPTYLDVQATIGISKHMGGYTATDEMHALCHLDRAEEVLDVGCGIGVGSAYVAKKYGCRVTAVDVSDDMLKWAQQRAEREGVSDQITFRKADVCGLPFEDSRFDVVLVESVLAFVKDKHTAILELLRVTKPGGYIGLNETYWTEMPKSIGAWDTLSIGPAIITEAEWRALWNEMPLEDRKIEVRKLDAAQEVRDRVGWVGWRYILPAWGRLFRMLFARRGSLKSIQGQLDAPRDMWGLLGYALFVGRKPGGTRCE